MVEDRMIGRLGHQAVKPPFYLTYDGHQSKDDGTLQNHTVCLPKAQSPEVING